MTGLRSRLRTGISSLKTNEEFRQGNAERVSNTRDTSKTDILFTAFEVPHVSPVDAADLCELLLRPSPLVPQIADSLAEARDKISHSPESDRMAAYRSTATAIACRSIA